MVGRPKQIHWILGCWHDPPGSGTAWEAIHLSTRNGYAVRVLASIVPNRAFRPFPAPGLRCRSLAALGGMRPTRFFFGNNIEPKLDSTGDSDLKELVMLRSLKSEAFPVLACFDKHLYMCQP